MAVAKAGEGLNAEDLAALVDFLGSVSHDPLKFVELAFPWGEKNCILEKMSGPEQWQRDELADIRDALKTPGQVIREATSSGNGIGKSALVSWIILWAISTFEDTRGVVTANTDTQLGTKTWAELSKWYNCFIGRSLFQYTATSIFSAQESHEKTWRIDAIPWNASNPAAFAGLHNQGKRTLVVFDEASEIPAIIWETAEGAMTDADTEVLWCVFGNPTQNSGRFYDCFHGDRFLWHGRKVDSRTVSFSNKTLIKEWELKYGKESDFWKIHVTGEAPASSENQFISKKIIEEAQQRKPVENQFNFAPIILGVDPAWTGGDEIVIYLRQGIYSKRLYTATHNENDLVVAKILADFEDRYKADAVFIDLGYGTGIKSAGAAWGRRWTLVPFGGKSTREDCINKRAEMWQEMLEWLRDKGGMIPFDDSILADDLSGPQIKPETSGKIKLESKDDMKKRGLASPNRADALALTFAFPVMRRDHSNVYTGMTDRNKANTNYDFGM